MPPTDDSLNAYVSWISCYFTYREILIEKCNRMRYFFKIKEAKWSLISIKCQDLYIFYVFLLQMKFIFHKCVWNYFIVPHICSMWVKIQTNSSDVLPVVYARLSHELFLHSLRSILWTRGVWPGDRIVWGNGRGFHLYLQWSRTIFSDPNMTAGQD